MKEIVVKKNDSGQRLDRFLTKSFGSLPQALMYKYIRTKRIKLNGKRAEISTRLNEGDLLQLYINDDLLAPAKPKYDFLSAPVRLDIIYEDENILLVNKPEGLVVHPDKVEYRDTLIMRIQHYLYDKGESTQKELAGYLNCSPAAVAVSIKRLERKGLLEKRVDNTDMRYNKITLTEEGKKRAVAARAGLDRIDRRCFDGFSQDELDTLKNFY